ncbi:hypothetical protein ACKKBG_A12105 [Auxenochlorella protothecoides x Auxenochlorella symbiontica]
MARGTARSLVVARAGILERELAHPRLQHPPRRRAGRRRAPWSPAPPSIPRVHSLPQQLRREQRGRSGSSSADWAAAEEILIRRTFQRQVAATLSIVKSMQRIAEIEADAAQEAAQKASTEATAGQATSGIGQSGIQSEASQHQGLPSTLLAPEEEAVPRPETVPVPRAFASQCAEAEGRRTLDSILHAEEEVAKLRVALEALTESAQQLLSGERGVSDART